MDSSCQVPDASLCWIHLLLFPRTQGHAKIIFFVILLLLFSRNGVQRVIFMHNMGVYAQLYGDLNY